MAPLLYGAEANSELSDYVHLSHYSKACLLLVHCEQLDLILARVYELRQPSYYVDLLSVINVMGFPKNFVILFESGLV